MFLCGGGLYDVDVDVISVVTCCPATSAQPGESGRRGVADDADGSSDG